MGARGADRRAGVWRSALVVFLREADELLRKIQLEALALAFGAECCS